MPSLRSTFAVTKQTILPASVKREDVISQLHDHSLMIKLNPIVVHHEKVQGDVSPPPTPNPDPNEDETTLVPEDDKIFANSTSIKYSITDRIAYLPGDLWTGSITYAAWFADAADGLRTLVRAPMGVVIRGSWKVRPVWPHDGEDQEAMGIYLSEEAIVSCNSLLRPFIQSTMQKSHDTLHHRFLERLVDDGHFVKDNV